MNTINYLDQFPSLEAKEDFIDSLFELRADDPKKFFSIINQFTDEDKSVAFNYCDVYLAFDYNAMPELEGKVEYLGYFTKSELV